jgi:signal transduction histidine kinase
MYGTLFLLSGVVLLGITYLLVRHDIGDNFVSTTRNGTTAIFTQDRGVGFGFARIAKTGPTAAISGGVQRRAIVSGSGGGASTVGAGSGSVTVQVPVPGVARGKAPSPKQVQEQLDILLSQAHAEQNSELHQLLLDSGIALMAAAVLSILLGWLVAGRVLRPLRLITAKAEVISSTNLHERMGLRGPDDEIKRLGDTFDALLERLERSFDAQRQFVANASHELRTPLTRQRALLEVASADPQADVGSLRRASARAVTAGEEQEQLIEALLTLASSERGLDERHPFDLATIARTVAESKVPEATFRGIRIETDLLAAPTSGDERLARRLVANLVDNALHYNLEDGWVALATTTEAGHAVLHVSNSGPVIPTSDVERLFRPFERMGRGRTARVGHGLGLSIVKAVAEAHGGSVVAVAPTRGGLDVEVRFPVSPARETASTRERAAAFGRHSGSSSPRD